MRQNPAIVFPVAVGPVTSIGQFRRFFKIRDTLRVATMQRYDNDTKRVLAEAREEQRQREERGYSREEAFADIKAVQAELRRL